MHGQQTSIAKPLDLWVCEWQTLGMAQITYTELAERARISRAYACQLLNGEKSSPSLEVALRVYDASGLQLGLLKDLKADEIQVLRKAAA